MKLRVAVDALVLRLAVSAKRLRTAAHGVGLRLTVAAKQLQVAIGQFIAVLYPADTVATVEDTAFATTKGLSNSSGIAPLVEVEFRKNINEGVGLDSGAPYFAEDYVDGWPFLQTYVVNPQPLKDIGKSLSDGGGFGGDSAYFAEDYVTGAPNSQTYTVSFQLAMAVGKGISDSIAAASLTVVYLQFGRILSDSYAGGDTLFKTFDKVLGHGVGATDDLNGALPLDDQTIEFFKSLGHIVSTGDAPAKVFERGLFETSGASDVRALTNTKILGHTAGVAEVNTRLIGKVSSDSAGAGSAGSLLAQGYTVDMTYFAEDYVGASRTF